MDGKVSRSVYHTFIASLKRIENGPTDSLSKLLQNPFIKLFRLVLVIDDRGGGENKLGMYSFSCFSMSYSKLRRKIEMKILLVIIYPSHL